MMCMRITDTFIFNKEYICMSGHLQNGKSVRQWPGRPGFNPRSSHTKYSKNCI